MKLFNAPFTAAPLDISQTGSALAIPVAILHGLDDTIVPPPVLGGARGIRAFAAIASQDKVLLFASSNRERDPKLVAFHNQAVTSTQTFDDALFDSFGGVKAGPNACNTAWIWPALAALFSNGVVPADLLRRLEQEDKPPYAVSAEPPPPRRRMWLWLLVNAGLVVAGVLAFR